MFVAKYSSGGVIQWVHELGSSQNDFAAGLAADGDGNVYITGFTEGGRLPGSPETGAGFVAKYSSGGLVQWVHEPAAFVNVQGAAVGGGNLYIAGGTYRGCFAKY